MCDGRSSTFFHCLMPGIPHPCSLAFHPLCPVELLTGKVILFPSHDMSDPSPSPLQDDGPHAFLVA